METKICKHCQTEIPKKAKVCPNCKKKQGGIVKWIVIAVVVLLLIGSMGGSDDTSNNSSVNNSGVVENNINETNASKGTNESDVESADNIFEVGEFLQTDYKKISYLSCEEYKPENPYMQPEEGYVYYRLEFEFENVGDSDLLASYFDFEGYADGYSIEQGYFDDGISATLSPGKKAKGAVYFEVPVDATDVTAEYEMNVWTEEKVVFVIK